MWDDAIDNASEDVREVFSEHFPTDVLSSTEDLEFEADAFGEDTEKVRIEKIDGQKTAILNLDRLPEADVEVIADYYFGEGGLFGPDTWEDISLMDAALSDEEFQEIVGYFEDYLVENDIKLLKRCLSIRQDWEGPEYTSKKEMYERRNELSKEQNFGEDALIVSNLCSSGYYDETGYIRTLFERVNEGSIEEENPHQRLYNLILAEEPFTIFVSPSDRPHKVTDEIIDKLEASDYYMISFDFVDARAQGGQNRDTLEKAVINLHLSSNLLKYKVEVNERETVYRFNPDDFEQIEEE